MVAITSASSSCVVQRHSVPSADFDNAFKQILPAPLRPATFQLEPLLDSPTTFKTSPGLNFPGRIALPLIASGKISTYPGEASASSAKMLAITSASSSWVVQ